jgi:hypothetical protein
LAGNKEEPGEGVTGGGRESTFHVFLLDQGSYTTQDVPGSIETFVNGINASSQIVGSYFDPTKYGTHGFLATPVP